LIPLSVFLGVFALGIIAIIVHKLATHKELKKIHCFEESIEKSKKRNLVKYYA